MPLRPSPPAHRPPPACAAACAGAVGGAGVRAGGVSGGCSEAEGLKGRWQGTAPSIQAANEKATPQAAARLSLPRKSADSHTGPTTSKVSTGVLCGAVSSMCCSTEGAGWGEGGRVLSHKRGTKGKQLASPPSAPKETQPLQAPAAGRSQLSHCSAPVQLSIQEWEEWG